MITSECINCGACEPECPNTAIYQGAVEWQAPDGAMHPALSSEIFYIVPEKCTECVGFHDHEACAAVCPVDCCVPNPDIPETHEVLLARARELHPEETIPDDAPSRFTKSGAEAALPPRALRPLPLPRLSQSRRPRPSLLLRGRPPPRSSARVWPFRRPRSGRCRSTASAARASTRFPSSAIVRGRCSAARTASGPSSPR